MSIKVGNRVTVIGQSRYRYIDFIGKRGTVKYVGDVLIEVALDGHENRPISFYPEELLIVDDIYYEKINHVDEFCKGCNGECYGAYPECESCELHARKKHDIVDRFNNLGLPNYVQSDERKESRMHYNGVKIKIGNKFYYPDTVEWKQTTGQFPELEISTRISPSNLDPTSNLSITNVIFNPPATIVFWSDKSKTVVKCDPKEEYDPEKGIAMAACKKMFGDNKRDYYNVFLHWIKKYEKQKEKK